MSSERIKTRKRTDFPGINRAISANDNPNGAAISRDGRRLPTGRFVRRQEYDNLYDYREQQYAHTTDDTSRKVRDDGTFDAGGTWGIPNTHEVYRSHGRKLIALGSNGGNEYVFTGYVEIHQTPRYHTLHIERASRAITALDMTWAEADTQQRLDVVNSSAGHAGFANDWIEFSMVMNAAKTSLYIIVTLHDDSGGGATEVRLYRVTNLYGATFSTATVTYGDNAAVGNSTALESSTDITRDVDIEIAASDSLYAIWGKTVGANEAIRYAVWSAAGGIGPISTYTDGAFDVYGISITYGSTLNLYLTYTITNGAARNLRYSEAVYSTLIITFGAAATIATNVNSTVVGTNDYLYRGVCAIDTGNVKHWLYLDTDGKLTHVGTSFSALQVTATVGTAIANMLTTGWDFVAKDGEACVFYVNGSENYRIYKAVRIVTSSDVETGVYTRSSYTDTWRHDLVEQLATTRNFRYFGAYRKYEHNTSKRLSYIACTTVTTTTHVKYLHSDKGLYALTDASHATQVTPVWLEEALMPKVNGTAEQVLIMQASDSRLYKRVNYMWMLLEGERLIDNSGWAWTTAFDDHARFLQYGSILHCLAGSGSTARNSVYQWIDRDFFTNGADVNTHSVYRYAGFHSDYQRLAPPPSNIVSSPPASAALADGIYNGFTSIINGVRTSKVSNLFPTAVNEDGSPKPNKYFHIAVSFEYDGSQESQLRLLTSNAASVVRVGLDPNYAEDNPGTWGNLIVLLLSMKSWLTATTPNSARITAINVYLGECIAVDHLADATNIPASGWSKVKRILVSKEKMTGENAFENKENEGTAVWATADAGVTWTLTSYIDFKDWGSREVRGTAEQNLGSSLARYNSTISGTEIYTRDTLIPEAYKFGLTLQNEVWVAGVRLAGVTRKNRLMRSARRLGSIVTPDALSDELATLYDFPYDIQGIGSIDDNTLVVKGTHGTDVFDVTGGMLTKRDDISKVGTTKPDTVFSIAEGSVGEMIKGVLSQDTLGHIRLFDGYGEGIISDAVRDDFALTSDTVDANNYGVLSLLASIKQIIYVPLHRCLFISYGTQIYVLDLAGGKDWQDWRFANGVNAACVGVDGEMFFTDNVKVYVWPQSGAVDNPNPLWRELDVENDKDTRLIPKKVWVSYVASGTTLQPKIWKDRGAVTNSTNTLAASSTQTRRRTGYSRSGASAMRETAVGFGVTSATSLTALEVDSIIQDFLIAGDRP